MRLRHLLLLSLCSFCLAFAACMLDPVEFAGKSCADAPCPDGLSCDPATLTCIGGVLPDAGSEDAGSDAGQPDCGCSSGLTCCDGQCVDLTSDKANCGACRNACSSLEGSLCRNSECRVDADVSKTLLWTTDAPGPYLAFWKDGTLLAAQEGSASNLKFDGKDVISSSLKGWQSRPTIYIPPNDTRGTEIALSHYGAFVAMGQNLKEVWRNDLWGCCGTTPHGFPTDPVLGQVYISDRAVLDAITGDDTRGDKGDLAVHVTQNALLGPSAIDNTVQKRSRSDHSLTFTIPVGQPDATGGPNFNPASALTADDGIVVSSTERNLIARISSTGAKWEKTLDAPTHPVITPDGVIVVGAGKPGEDRLEAHRVADGSKVWEAPMPGRVHDLLVADNGMIYVAVEKSVLGVLQSDGRVSETYRNLPLPEEMLLRDGVIYAWGADKVTAFKVTAKGYPKSSPWPVRYHDNQRTSSRTASLDY